MLFLIRQQLLHFLNKFRISRRGAKTSEVSPLDKSTLGPEEPPEAGSPDKTFCRSDNRILAAEVSPAGLVLVPAPPTELEEVVVVVVAVLLEPVEAAVVLALVELFPPALDRCRVEPNPPPGIAEPPPPKSCISWDWLILLSRL